MFDAIIIGGGPGGYTCATQLAKAKKKVVLIEQENLGGVCTNWGCIPTKAMISSAKTIVEIKKADRKGIVVPKFSLDFEKLMKRKDRIVTIMRKGIEQKLLRSNVKIIKGKARLISKNEVEVNKKKI
jgi:dihydrolipoamide dehydrogenase